MVHGGAIAAQERIQKEKRAENHQSLLRNGAARAELEEAKAAARAPGQSSSPSRMAAARTVVHRPRLSPTADWVMFMVRTILLDMR
jgi:hypothetical protein